MTIDPCIYCGESTAFGATRPDGTLIGKFVNRIGADRIDEQDEYLDGYACAECAGFECNECGKQIYLDCEVRVEAENSQGYFIYGNYHAECHNEAKHGKACYGLGESTIVPASNPAEELIKEHYGIILTALDDYRNWWDADSEDEVEHVNEIDIAINAIYEVLLGLTDEREVTADIEQVNSLSETMPATPPFYTHPDSNAFISWD